MNLKIKLTKGKKRGIISTEFNNRRYFMKKIKYGVKGMSCAVCVSHVEASAEKLCGKGNVNVSLLTNSITVTVADDKDERLLFGELKKLLKGAGYTLVPDNSKNSEIDRTEQKNSLLRLIISCVLTVFLMYVAMGHMLGIYVPSIIREPLISASLQLFITIPVIILNFKFFRNGISALIRLSPNMDSLIAIGSGASLIYGVVMLVLIAVNTAKGDTEAAHSLAHGLYFESAAMILTLVSLGKTLEGRAKANASAAIGRLASMLPSTATVLKNGKESETPLSDLAVGDIIIVKAGQAVPVDGTIIEGEAAVDESILSGESIPVEKSISDKVSAVCTLRSGYIKIKADSVGGDTALAKIISLLEDAASSKAPIARLADKVSKIFVPTVMGISLLTFILWMVSTGDISIAIDCAVSVLVISCPCALGLATPTAITVGTGRGASKGILIKSALALENLHSVKFFLTDKTGTITKGKPTVTDIYELNATREQILSAAYSAEAMSSHPLAGAICEEAQRRGIKKLEGKGFENFVGRGISVEINGRVCLVGRPDFLTERGIDSKKAEQATDILAEYEQDGKTAVCVALDKTILGIIAIADEIREDSRVAVKQLKARGIEPIMLTGDNKKTALAVAKQCDIDTVYAELLPTDKEGIIREYSKKGRVSMVGDGINDAPALAAADIGIAIGAGTDVAIDCADVVLTKSSLRDAVSAISLSKATMVTIKQNLFWALIYNAICIPIAAGALFPVFGIKLSPMLASAAMSLSSVCVVLNSIRLRYRKIFE